MGVDMNRFETARHIAAWASIGRAKRGAATAIWAPSSTRPPMLLLAPQAPICPPSIIGSRRASARRKPSSQLNIRSWLLPII
jgi:hypothetical protein